MQMEGKKGKHNLKENSETNFDEILLYKNVFENCEKFKQHFDQLKTDYDSLKSKMEGINKIELDREKAEEKVRNLTRMLSQTQTQLIVERKNAQAMALHIDLLLEQHEADVRKLDLLLALDKKSVTGGSKEESSYKCHAQKLEKLIKEQASELLEERALMKAEWDKEQQISSKCTRELKLKIQKLEDQLLLANQHRASSLHKEINNFLTTGETSESFRIEKLPCQSDVYNDLFNKPNHCLTQETRKLKKKCNDLQEEVNSYQKRCISQSTQIKDLKDELTKNQEKYKSHIRILNEKVEILEKETKQLNKRRLNEGAGFRSEILLLRDQLERTQKQLCFLSMRKFEA